jgi:hypothetical protein
VADEPAPAQRRSLLDYMMAIAVADYGFVPSRRGSRTRPLTPGRIERLLLEAGFGTPDLTTHSTITDLTAQAAWLSIPVFTETRLAGMSYAERMSVLSKALQKFESVGSRSEEWHVFVATLGA